MNITDENYGSIGAGGGGGGEGGQGGFGGDGGDGGGGSFAIFVWDNGPGGSIQGNILSVGQAGFGGIGGQGGVGGQGGDGGDGGLDPVVTGPNDPPAADDTEDRAGGCQSGAGGDGGNGGDGGDGGDGGNGGDGVAQTFYQNITIGGNLINPIPTTDPLEPVIEINTAGCAKTEVNLAVANPDPSATYTWSFDNDAYNPSATGASATVEYETPGPKTFSLQVVGNSGVVSYTYSGLIEILVNPITPTPDHIFDYASAGDDSVCINETVDFTETLTGTLSQQQSLAPNSYVWELVDPAGNVQTLGSTSGTVTTPTLSTAGVYWVRFRAELTSTSCIACGTTYLDSLPITVREAIPVTATPLAVTSEFCEGGTAVFEAVVTPTTTPNSVEWFDATNTSVGTTSNLSIASPSDGDSFYPIVTFTDECATNPNFTATTPPFELQLAPLSVTVYEDPVVACPVDIQAISGTAGTYTFDITSIGTAAYTWEIEPGTGPQNTISGSGTGTSFDATLSYGGSGNFTGSITVTDDNGCAATCDQLNTEVLGADERLELEITSPTQTVFCDEFDPDAANLSVDYTPANADIVYDWVIYSLNTQGLSYGGANNIPGNGSPITNIGSGVPPITNVETIVIKVVGTYAGVSDSDSVVVNVVPPVDAQISPASNINCLNEPIDFQFDLLEEAADSPFDWTITGPTGTDNVSQFGPLTNYQFTQGGTYDIQVVVPGQAPGCDATATTTIDINEKPDIELDYSFIERGCGTATVAFTPILGPDPNDDWTVTEYVLYPGDGSEIPILPSGEQFSETYAYTSPPFAYSARLIAIEEFGCRDTSGVRSVPITPDYTVNIEPDTTEPMRVELENPVVDVNATNSLAPDQQPDIRYLWDIKDGAFANGSGDTDERITVEYPQLTERYLVLQGTYEGCTVYDSILVETYQNTFLYIPNVFSPNGDGLNDDFELNLKNTEYTLAVWDRWGRQVYAGDENDPFWNGRVDNNGDPVPEGVYVFVIEYQTSQYEGQRSGTVTVLR